MREKWSVGCWQVWWSSYLYRAEHINNVVMLGCWELFNIIHWIISGRDLNQDTTGLWDWRAGILLNNLDFFSLTEEIVCSELLEQFLVPNKNCHKISKIWREVERGSCLLLNFPFRGWTFVTFWTFTIFYELGVKPTCQSQNRNILWSEILPVLQYIQRYSLCVLLPHTYRNVPLKHFTFSLLNFIYELEMCRLL